MLRDDLLNLLNKHRQEAFVTCEESCICWELERIIYEFDQDQLGNLTMRDTDATVCDCPKVDGVVYHVVGCSTGFFNSLRRIR